MDIAEAVFRGIAKETQGQKSRTQIRGHRREPDWLVAGAGGEGLAINKEKLTMKKKVRKALVAFKESEIRSL